MRAARLFAFTVLLAVGVSLFAARSGCWSSAASYKPGDRVYYRAPDETFPSVWRVKSVTKNKHSLEIENERDGERAYVAAAGVSPAD